jgi:hypothetical protein
MSKLHYFQRYQSKENWVTNATLLLLSRLYHYNRLKFAAVINSILEESRLTLNIGTDFNQQQKGEISVVDGVISQESFKVVIETKLYDNFSTDQLISHFRALNGNYTQKILLGLSKNKVKTKIRNEIISTLEDKEFSDIKFASTTYEDIYKIISHNLSEYDLEMKEILDDYFSLCIDNDLTNIENRTMAVFTAGDSFIDNLKYRIYYDSVSRSHNYPFQYIGLYVNKTVAAIGKLEKIVCCDLIDNKLVATNDDDLSKLTEIEYDRIKETIINTDYYDLKQGNKFFLVDNFYETNYIKTSFSSLRSKKYFWLDEIHGFQENMTAEQLANLLNEKTWE